MNEKNKIISFNDEILKREQENYIASIKISLFNFPIIGQFVLLKTTLKNSAILKDEIFILLETVFKTNRYDAKQERCSRKIGKQDILIDFYMKKDEDIYFRTDAEDEILSSAIILSLNTLRKQRKYGGKV